MKYTSLQVATVLRDAQIDPANWMFTELPDGRVEMRESPAGIDYGPDDIEPDESEYLDEERKLRESRGYVLGVLDEWFADVEVSPGEGDGPPTDNLARTKAWQARPHCYIG